MLTYLATMLPDMLMAGFSCKKERGKSKINQNYNLNYFRVNIAIWQLMDTFSAQKKLKTVKSFKGSRVYANLKLFKNDCDS